MAGFERIKRWVFLAVAVLLAYPITWNIFWWGVTVNTAFEVALGLSYICFGLMILTLTPHFRWVVRLTLRLSVVYLLPQVVMPPSFVSEFARFGCLAPALGCCVYLLLQLSVSARDIRQRV
jgi:hypothetical protein